MIDGAPIDEGDQDPLVGTTIDGRYEVEAVLGEGGMGIVYRAKHIVLGKSLAVKVLRGDVSRDTQIIARFRQEAQSASSIGNQHIIDISDFGTLPDGATYFVMEHLEGRDLTAAIEERRVSPERTVHIAKQLCQALGAAHGSGIVHRDLKPDNVYLIRRGSDDDFVKVLDFGIAKVGGSSSKLTRAGQVFGTPHYMSPEQCAGNGVDHRTDVYALGVILYEMVTGDVPFDADNLMGILSKHLYEAPASPRDTVSDLPRELETVILKCMAKTADERYQTMAELQVDLERIEQGMTPLGREPTSTRLALDHSGATPKQSKKGLLVGVLAAVLVLGGGAAAYSMMGNKAAEPPPENIEKTPAPPVAETPPEPVATKKEPEPAKSPRATIRIVSEPAGAEVWRGDEYIGKTPVDIPKPDTGSRLQLELRRDGFDTRAFAVSSLTQARELNFTLKAERSSRSSSRRSRRTRSSEKKPEKPQQATPPAPMRRVPQSEVLDPWAE